MMRRYFLFYTNRFCWGAWIWMCVVNHIAFCFSPSTYLLHTPWIGKQPRYTYTQIDRDVFLCSLFPCIRRTTQTRSHEHLVCVCTSGRESSTNESENEKSVGEQMCVRRALNYSFSTQKTLAMGELTSEQFPHTDRLSYTYTHSPQS